MVVPSLFQLAKYRAEAGSAQGDEADKVSAAWQKLNAPLQERVSHLEILAVNQQNKIDEQQRLIDNMTNGIRMLVDQVISLGGVPVYRGPEDATPEKLRK
jgi:hypothetical protein